MPRLHCLCLFIKLIIYSFIHEEFFSITNSFPSYSLFISLAQPHACFVFLSLTISPSTHVSARTSPTLHMPLDFSSAEDAFLPISPTACTLFKAAAPKYNPGGFASQMPPLTPKAPHRHPPTLATAVLSTV